MRLSSVTSPAALGWTECLEVSDIVGLKKVVRGAKVVLWQMEIHT